MKTPTVEQLQAWTAQWDEAKHYLSYQKVFDQRLQRSQPASVAAKIRRVLDSLVNQVAAQDQQAKNLQKAQVTGIVAGKQIATLRNELDRALEDLGLEPPWSARNSKSGLYRTDEHVIPLAIRLLDGLRLSKASGYADFAEDDYAYGYKSPFADSHLAVNKSLEEVIKDYPKHADYLYQQALAKRVDVKGYVDELTSRLFNLNVDIMQIPAEKRDDIKNSLHKDVSTLMARTEGDILASIDESMTEKTTRLIDRLMNDYFSTWREELTDEENVELQTTIRSKIEEVFKQFNQEKNAERHLSDCFDLAFCAKASESDQSAARLQALRESGVIDIPGVQRGASVNSAQSLLDIDETVPIEKLQKDATHLAKRAVRVSSYGLLKAILDEMNTRNIDFADDDWIDMTKDALKGCEPSIIKQCLHFKDINGKYWLEGCREYQQFVLLREAISADKHEHGMRINEDRLQMLLDRGVSVNAKDAFGDTALMFADSWGDETIILRLIKAGIKINAKNPFGQTALAAACARGKEAVVTQLIEAGADVNVRDRGGQTPLMNACRQGNEAVVTMLIKAGVNTYAKDECGDTALMKACILGRETVIEAMISHDVDVDVKGRDGKTALMYACEKGKEAVATKLIEAKADLNIVNDYGKTALMYACTHGKEAVVTKLIEAGVNIDAKDRYGQTALMYACAKGNETVVEAMISYDVDVDIKGRNGKTVLMIACEYGKEAVVTKLIEAKADLNIVDDYGKTALMYACSGGLDNVVSWLLEAGADVNTKDSKGKTAYDYAVDKGYADLANRVTGLESVGTRANRIARETGRALGDPTVLTALAGITTAALYASGSLDTALESASQAMPDIVSTATNVTSQALTELTTAAIEIGRQMGYGPSL